MTGEAAALARSFPVGSYVATVTIPRPKPGTPMAACIEWSPSMPARLTAAELEQYRAGRDAALRDLANTSGLSVLVLEV